MIGNALKIVGIDLEGIRFSNFFILIICLVGMAVPLTAPSAYGQVEIAPQTAPQTSPKTINGLNSEQWADKIINDFSAPAGTSLPADSSTRELLQLYYHLFLKIANIDAYVDERRRYRDLAETLENQRHIEIADLFDKMANKRFRLEDYLDSSDWFVQLTAIATEFSIKNSIPSRSEVTAMTNLIFSLMEGKKGQPEYEIGQGIAFNLLAMVAFTVDDLAAYVEYERLSNIWLKSYVTSDANLVFSLGNASTMHFVNFRDDQSLKILDKIILSDTGEAGIVSIELLRIQILSYLGRFDEVIATVKDPYDGDNETFVFIQNAFLAQAHAAIGEREKAAEYLLKSEAAHHNNSTSEFSRIAARIILSFDELTDEQLSEIVQVPVYALNFSRSRFRREKSDNTTKYNEITENVNRLNIRNLTAKASNYRTAALLMGLTIVMGLLASLLLGRQLRRNLAREVKAGDALRDKYNRIIATVSDTVVTTDVWGKNVQDIFLNHEKTIENVSANESFNLLTKSVFSWSDKVRENLNMSLNLVPEVLPQSFAMSDIELMAALKKQAEIYNKLFDSTIVIKANNLPQKSSANFTYIEYMIASVLRSGLSESTMNLLQMSVSHERRQDKDYLTVEIADDHSVMGPVLNDLIRESQKTVGFPKIVNGKSCLDPLMQVNNASISISAEAGAGAILLEFQIETTSDLMPVAINEN